MVWFFLWIETKYLEKRNQLDLDLFKTKYEFCMNFELQLSSSGYQKKTLPLPKHWKNRTTMFWVDLIFERYEDAMVFRVFIFIFSFRTNGKVLMRATFIAVLVVFSKLPFWKLLDHSFVQSWKLYVHGSRYVIILISRLESTWWNENKNSSLHFKEHCTKINDISLIFIRFFFSQTNLVMKFNPVFIGIPNDIRELTFSLTFLVYRIDFATIYLPFYLWIIDILRILEFSQCHNDIFIRTSSILMRAFSASKCLYYVIFLDIYSLLTAKKLLTLINICNFYMPCKSSAVLSMLDAAFDVWSWPQLNWCTRY